MNKSIMSELMLSNDTQMKNNAVDALELIAGMVYNGKPFPLVFKVKEDRLPKDLGFVFTYLQSELGGINMFDKRTPLDVLDEICSELEFGQELKNEILVIVSRFTEEEENDFFGLDLYDEESAEPATPVEPDEISPSVQEEQSVCEEPEPKKQEWKNKPKGWDSTISKLKNKKLSVQQAADKLGYAKKAFISLVRSKSEFPKPSCADLEVEEVVRDLFIIDYSDGYVKASTLQEIVFDMTGHLFSENEIIGIMCAPAVCCRRKAMKITEDGKNKNVLFVSGLLPKKETISAYPKYF